MPSSGSSSLTNEILLQNLIASKGEPEEKETRYTNVTLGYFQEATSERRVQVPSFRSSPVLRGSEIMNLYPPASDKIYSCLFCKKEFSSPYALGGHQNAHKQEREFVKKLKELEAEFPGVPFLNHYQDKPHILLGGYSKNAFSNENHLGTTLEPFNPLVCPSFNGGVTGGIADMNMAIYRPTPNRFFTGNMSTNGPFPSNNNMYQLITRKFPPCPLPSTNGSASEGFGHFPSNNNMYLSTPRDVFSFPPLSTNGSASKSSGVFPSNNNMYPSTPRDVFPFPPPRTSRDCFPQEKVLSDVDLTLRLGINNVVEIDDTDDEDEPEEGAYGNGGIDLSLSL